MERLRGGPRMSRDGEAEDMGDFDLEGVVSYALGSSPKNARRAAVYQPTQPVLPPRPQSVSLPYTPPPAILPDPATRAPLPPRRSRGHQQQPKQQQQQQQPPSRPHSMPVRPHDRAPAVPRRPGQASSAAHETGRPSSHHHSHRNISYPAGSMPLPVPPPQPQFSTDYYREIGQRRLQMLMEKEREMRETEATTGKVDAGASSSTLDGSNNSAAGTVTSGEASPAISQMASPPVIASSPPPLPSDTVLPTAVPGISGWVSMGQPKPYGTPTLVDGFDKPLGAGSLHGATYHVDKDSNNRDPFESTGTASLGMTSHGSQEWRHDPRRDSGSATSVASLSTLSKRMSQGSDHSGTMGMSGSASVGVIGPKRMSAGSDQGFNKRVSGGSDHWSLFTMPTDGFQQGGFFMEPNSVGRSSPGSTNGDGWGAASQPNTTRQSPIGASPRNYAAQYSTN